MVVTVREGEGVRGGVVVVVVGGGGGRRDKDF